MSLQDVQFALKGGRGSGDFGHGGRPGKRGGSAGGGKRNFRKVSIASHYRPPNLFSSTIDKLEELGKWEMFSAAEELGVSADLNAFDRVNRKWVQGADSSAKPVIKEMLKNSPDVRELVLYELWSNDSKNISFREWLDTPKDFFRGGGIRSDEFLSFSMSESIARDASGVGKDSTILKITTKPSNLLGGSGAGEVYVDEDAELS